ncbi:GATOR complex protein NPRL3 [Aphelenchoides bicaudatus]|nr:GATOR complex protein NPRL3 [Aphelenchoides bicaudatus]
MNKLQRPLGLILITNDEASGRVLFMYPHSIELPPDLLEDEIQLDTNSILMETNNLVDVQRTSNSAEDSDGNAAGSLEKSSNEELNRIPHSPPVATTSPRTTHKSENQTRATASTSAISSLDQESDRRKEWRSQQFNSFDEPAESLSDGQRRATNSGDSLLNGDLNKKINEEADLNKRREKKNQLPTKMIIGMLNPVEHLNEVPFEITINTARYVCNPWHIRKTGQCIAVVFVLHASCNDQIIESYQNLSRKIATAIDNEQTRCNYLRDEIQAIQPYLERIEEIYTGTEPRDSESFGEEHISFADVEKHSSLARTLRQIYEDIYQYGILDVFVNDCIQVGFCIDPFHSFGQNIPSFPIIDVDNIMHILQPYHTVLFFEDCAPGPDANPYVLRFFEHYDLERSLNEIGMFSRMPLEQIKAVARHYILWGCAKIIYPLCNTNVYSTMESNPTTKTACATFRRSFGPNIGLGTILSAFHPPSNFGTVFGRAVNILFAPDSQAKRFNQPLSVIELNLLSNRIKTQIRQFKQVDETIKNALLRISVDTIAAGMTEPDFFWFLSTFISMHPFLNGDYHVEAIMCYKQLDRSAVTRILDLFSDILIVLSAQATIVPVKLSEYPKRLGTATSVASTVAGRRRQNKRACVHRTNMNEDPALVLVSEWIPPSELLPYLELGDLIEFDRSSRSRIGYYHWAVYAGVEDGIKTVIHFSNEHGDFESQDVKMEFKGKLINGSLAHIRADPYISVVGQSLYARINNSLDRHYDPFPPIIIRDRAIAKLGSTGYNLLFNNCEQFCKWARYGRHESDQSSTFTTTVSTLGTLLFTGSATAAVGAGLFMYSTVRIGRKLMHRYWPTGVI